MGRWAANEGTEAWGKGTKARRDAGTKEDEGRRRAQRRLRRWVGRLRFLVDSAARF